MKRTTESSILLPVEVLNRASALLVAREVRRPPETLAFLTQRLLRWWTVIKGVPTFDPPALKSLARDFREMGFDCLPGKNPRWTPKQRAHAESLFHELVLLVAVNPGFPKQRFIEATAGRFNLLKTMTGKLPDRPLLGIDGGITRDTIAMVSPLGADIIVSGSAVFEGGRIQENFDLLMNGINHK